MDLRARTPAWSARAVSTAGGDGRGDGSEFPEGSEKMMRRSIYFEDEEAEESGRMNRISMYNDGKEVRPIVIRAPFT